MALRENLADNIFAISRAPIQCAIGTAWSVFSLQISDAEARMAHGDGYKGILYFGTSVAETNANEVIAA
ncbi:MAG: hypothetical protein ABIP88_16540 [Candidatus Binatia bacterium]